GRLDRAAGVVRPAGGNRGDDLAREGIGVLEHGAAGSADPLPTDVLLVLACRRLCGRHLAPPWVSVAVRRTGVLTSSDFAGQLDRETPRRRLTLRTCLFDCQDAALSFAESAADRSWGVPHPKGLAGSRGCEIRAR